MLNFTSWPAILKSMKSKIFKDKLTEDDENHDINILLCLNSNLYKYLFVTLASIFINNPHKKINIHIFESNLTSEQKYNITEYIKLYNGKISFYNITHKMAVGFDPLFRIPIEAYFYFFAADLLPLSIKRILYLDIDIIVDKSLSHIYEIEFEEYVAMCEIPDRISYDNFLANKDKAKNCFFNSGVILFNLDKLRQDNFYVNKIKKTIQNGI